MALTSGIKLFRRRMLRVMFHSGIQSRAELTLRARGGEIAFYFSFSNNGEKLRCLRNENVIDEGDTGPWEVAEMEGKRLYLEYAKFDMMYRLCRNQFSIGLMVCSLFK